jgi:hypothetical protein
VRVLIQAAAVSSSILALASAEVHGQNGLTISILNDSGDALIVNAYDRVPRPPQQVVTNATIYGNASLPISITPNDSGRGHLRWTAVTQDRDMRACGHGDKSNLHDGDTVTVHADGECAHRR